MSDRLAFLDDRLVTGDSLLGVAFVEQLEALHLDPAAGRRRTEGSFDQPWNPVRRILGEASDQTDPSDELAARATAVLQAGRPPGTTSRVCLQWPLAFPEMFSDTAVSTAAPTAG